TLFSPPWEEHLSALHHPSLSPTSSEGSKIQQGRSTNHYTINKYKELSYQRKQSVADADILNCFSLLPQYDSPGK
ncbi:unnamed protein product, partial [Bubo scandiacus]